MIATGNFESSELRIQVYFSCFKSGSMGIKVCAQNN